MTQKFRLENGGLINRKKIPLMIALLNAITKNKKLKIKY